MTRAVVTGATGMLGRALTEQLVASGSEVLVLVNPASKRLKNIMDNPAVSIAACDIARLKNFEAPDQRGYDVFYHLAWGGTFGDARNDAYAQAENIRYTLDAVEAANRLGCTRFVGAGSQAEYGRVSGKLSAETPTNPENGYGIAKLAAGRLARLLCQQKGIECMWTRILSVYGPDDGMQTMVMSTIATLLDGGVPSLTPCQQQWDYLYRGDAGRALQLIGERGQDGAVYPVGSGQARPLLDYVEAIRDAIDPALPLGVGERPYADKQVMHLCADIDSLTHDTGFTPQINFQTGIRNTIEWMKAKRV